MGIIISCIHLSSRVYRSKFIIIVIVTPVAVIPFSRVLICSVIQCKSRETIEENTRKEKRQDEVTVEMKMTTEDLKVCL